VRESLRGQDLTFTEIAKVVGERWQVLPPEEREVCERQASAAKEKYYSELAEYKKTPQYEAYQKYLGEFRAKHPTKGWWTIIVTLSENNHSFMPRWEAFKNRDRTNQIDPKQEP
jgi:hypothetical protein